MITLIEHEDYYKHKMPQIMETPRRLKAIMKALEDNGLLSNPHVKKVAPEVATIEDLKTIHSEQLIDLIKHSSMLGITQITSDTITNEFTFQSAIRAVGGAKLAADLVSNKTTKVAFALTRPPGHHATRTNSMGFCFFNNIAFAANYLVSKKKLKRVAIIDFDHHYGNGTADLFYSRNDILKISLHVDPTLAFPYQGRVSEIGERAGEGFNICVPLPAQTGDKEYLQTFDRVVPPIILDYKPELILVAAGYDGLLNDPSGYLSLSVSGFQQITERILSLAEKTCDGKLVFTLEGGYKIDELGQAFIASISPFVPDFKFPEADPSKLTTGGNKNQLKDTLYELKNVLKPFWKLE